MSPRNHHKRREEESPCVRAAPSYTIQQKNGTAPTEQHDSSPAEPLVPEAERRRRRMCARARPGRARAALACPRGALQPVLRHLVQVRPARRAPSAAPGASAREVLRPRLGGALLRPRAVLRRRSVAPLLFVPWARPWPGASSAPGNGARLEPGGRGGRVVVVRGVRGGGGGDVYALRSGRFVRKKGGAERRKLVAAPVV